MLTAAARQRALQVASALPRRMGIAPIMTSAVARRMSIKVADYAPDKEMLHNFEKLETLGRTSVPEDGSK